ncbi:arginine-tRNA-protein transferase [Chytridium lagenaria]|nr:arginine-tRNA-protein transferase [Chytridium lagenaria]
MVEDDDDEDDDNEDAKRTTEKTSTSFGMWAYKLNVRDYQALIDKGWRRSGQYVYKPTISTTCCPAYTIRLHASKYVPNKSHKKVGKKVRKFLSTPAGEKEVGGDEDVEEGGDGVMEPRPLMTKAPVDADVSKVVMPDSEMATDTRGDMVESAVESTAKRPKGDKGAISHPQRQARELTPDRFTNFLVDSPLEAETIGKVRMGSFHQKYYLDGILIAVGFLDILPSCVSSVYFIYDPSPEILKLSMGVYGAVREISLVMDLEKINPNLKYYYLGYYIHSCPKMRYKGQYRPSDLACPLTYQWVSPGTLHSPPSTTQGRASLLRPSHLPPSPLPILGPESIFRAPPEESVKDAHVAGLMAFTNGKVIQLQRRKDVYPDAKKLFHLLGEELMKRIVLVVS